MTVQIESQRTRGMRDLLPEALHRFRRVERSFLDVIGAWGYAEVRTPTLEHLHLFTAAGALSPQMLDRVYSFLDWDGWSGERVVLRPDATIPAARLYREHFDGGVAKLAYVTNIFRFAQGDEPRERWQCGAEVVGDTWPFGDIELIAAGRAVLDRLGLGPVTVRLSHTGIIRALLDRAGYPPEDQAERYDRLLEGDLSVMREIEERVGELQVSMHLLTGVTGRGVAYLANLRAAMAGLTPALGRALDELEQVAAAADGLGCPVEIDLTMLRDFEYYTGPVFRFILPGGWEAGGGGRYDALVGEGEGEGIPACGFALDMDRLAELLPDADTPVAHVIEVSPNGAEASAAGLALAVCAELQAKGFCAELVPSARPAAGRWRLAVDAAGSGPRYRLTEPGGDETAAGTMESLIGALGRARC